MEEIGDGLGCLMWCCGVLLGLALADGVLIATLVLRLARMVGGGG